LANRIDGLPVATQRNENRDMTLEEMIREAAAETARMIYAPQNTVSRKRADGDVGHISFAPDPPAMPRARVIVSKPFNRSLTW
jgi:hypothetical protein